MAAPHVAAIAAMYILNDSTLTPSTVQTLVMQHYDAPEGWQTKYGVGIVSVASAFDADTPDEPDEPDEPDVPDTPDESDEPDEPDEPDTPDIPDMPNLPIGIVLTQSNTSELATIGTGYSGRIPVTLTAPSDSNVTVTLNAPGGSSNANDPALFNSAGMRIAYQNNGWGFTHTLTLNAGQSWNGFVGTGGDVARSYALTSSWFSQNTLTLNPASVTVDDNNLIRTITVSGTTTGTVTLDRGTLPSAVQLSVSGSTITATGIRPAAGQAAITGTHTVTVNRDGRSTQLSISVNLTPQVSGLILTQSSTSATANVGTGINGRVPITVTAPSANSIVVTLIGPGGTSNANDPALYNSAGVRIAYQNNGWGFTHTLTINAGQSWNGFVGTGGDVARTYVVSSSGWLPPATLTLNPASVTVDNNNLTRTITAGGTATGSITIDRGTLPLAVQLSVSGNTITATGIRPAAGQAAITGTHIVTVNRGGISTQLSISVNLTPQNSAITLTQSNTSATANVGSGFHGRVPITVTAPSTHSVAVTLNGPGGWSNADDPALYNSAGTRIAYQNNGWGFTHTLTLNAGQSWSGFVGTGGDVARTYVVSSSGWTTAPAGIVLNQNNTSATANVGTGFHGRVPITVTVPSTHSVAVTLNGPGGTSNANDPALYNSAGVRIAYQNNGWGFTHTITLNAGQSWSGFVGTGGDVARTYTITSSGWTTAPVGIVLTQSNTSATANVGAGINSRVPVTITAPSNSSVTVTITAPGGTTNANDPALYNSAGVRIAYQNNGWGFTHTITLNAGQSWSGFAGTGGNVARQYTISSTFKG
jgi:hypothetical protein